MRSHRRAAFGLLAVLGALPAWSSPYLEEGRRHYHALEFEEAIVQLEIARKVPTDDRSERFEVLDLLGRCYVATGRRAKAEAAFTDLLLADPQRALGADTSPRIREAFDAAKQRLYAADYVELRKVPSPAGELRFELVDPWRQVTEVALVVPGAPEERRTAARSFAFAFERDGGWTVEARDARGRVLDSKAMWTPAMGEPVVVEQRRVRTGAWVAGGAALLAGVTAGYLQSRSFALGHEARSREWSDDARRLHAEANLAAGWSAGLFAAAGVSAVAATALFVW